MASIEDSLKNNQAMQQEIERKQRQIIQRYQKRLNQKKMLELQNFIQSGKQVGSSHFLKLSPVVQEVVLKLNLSGVDIMAKNTKNPIRKVQFALSKTMMKKLESAPRGKKKGAANTKKKKGFSWNPITISSAVISAGAVVWISVSLLSGPKEEVAVEVIAPTVNVAPSHTQTTEQPSDTVLDTTSSAVSTTADTLSDSIK